jgi:hypothetical protein
VRAAACQQKNKRPAQKNAQKKNKSGGDGNTPFGGKKEKEKSADTGGLPQTAAQPL